MKNRKLFKTSLLLALLATPAQATTILFDGAYVPQLVKTGDSGTVDIQVLWTDVQLRPQDLFFGTPSVYLGSRFVGYTTFDYTSNAKTYNYAPVGFDGFYNGTETSLSQIVTIDIASDLLWLFITGVGDHHGMSAGKTQLMLTYDDGLFAVPSNAVIVTPLPAALPLFTAGLGIVTFLARRRKAQ